MHARLVVSKLGELVGHWLFRRTAHDLDRAMRVGGNRMRNRAEPETLPTAVAVRADDDQISFPLLGFIQDHIAGTPTVHFGSDFKQAISQSRRRLVNGF